MPTGGGNSTNSLCMCPVGREYNSLNQGRNPGQGCSTRSVPWISAQDSVTTVLLPPEEDVVNENIKLFETKFHSFRLGRAKSSS